jgi:Protein of unknown function (DUF2505)
MPRSFDMSADYDGGVEEVHRAFSERDYWLGRLQNSAVDESKLESMRVGGESGNDGTIDVVTLQVMHSQNLPGLITQLHRGDLRVRREEKWGPTSDGVATASWADRSLTLRSTYRARPSCRLSLKRTAPG